MKKTHIIIHHSLVSYTKNPSQFEAIERYHAGKGWGKGTGYNFVIEKDGLRENGRSLSTLGAHCYQQGMNRKSIGICLSGDFDIEEPTREQCESLLKLILELQEAHGIPDENVELHRDYATYKSCPGNLIPDNILNGAEDLYFIAFDTAVIRPFGEQNGGVILNC